MRIRTRIALFVPTLVGGGAEKVIVNLANGIAEQNNYDVDLILVANTGPYASDISEKVTVHVLKSHRISTSILPLVKYLRDNKPVALVSALSTANIVAIIASKLCIGNSIRTIITEHNTLSRVITTTHIKRQKLIPYFVRLLYRHASSVVACSKGVADDISYISGLQRDAIEVIYNPVITEKTKFLAREKITHPWFIQHDIPVVLAVGRLVKIKDFEMLIDSIAIANQSRQIRLVILGEGECKYNLEQLAKERNISDCVDLTGFVSNPYPYMVNSSLFVISSRSEGLPTALIEAMYCDTKLVSTDLQGGVREILRDGDYGELVRPQDPDAMAAAILRALEKDDVSSAKDREQHLEKFTMQFSVDHYLRHILTIT